MIMICTMRCHGQIYSEEREGNAVNVVEPGRNHYPPSRLHAADMDFAAGLNRAACMKRRKRVVLQQSIVRPILYNFGGNSASMKADFGILRQCLSAAGERRSLCNLHNNTPQNIEIVAPRLSLECDHQSVTDALRDPTETHLMSKSTRLKIA